MASKNEKPHLTAGLFRIFFVSSTVLLVLLATLMLVAPTGVIAATATPVWCANVVGAVSVRPVPAAPDVPTAQEKGYDLSLSTWQGLSAPKGLPKPVKASLVQAFEKSMKDPQSIQMLRKLDCSVTYYSPEETEKKIQEENKLFLEVWDRIGKK